MGPSAPCSPPTGPTTISTTPSMFLDCPSHPSRRPTSWASTRPAFSGCLRASMPKPHRLGPVGEFPEGTHQVVRVGNREVGVFNIGGDFHALPNLCPHQR